MGTLDSYGYSAYSASKFDAYAAAKGVNLLFSGENKGKLLVEL